MYENMDGILVVDHVNHFSPASLYRLFVDAGFAEIAVNTEVHKAVLLLTAQRPEEHALSAEKSAEACSTYVGKAPKIAARCQTVSATIDAHAAKVEGTPVVIYGSGICGMMILAAITDRALLLAFLDNNRFRQGGHLFGISVEAPEDIPAEARAVRVGRKPVFAREMIDAMPHLRAA
jgi:hypothetical protein